MYRFENERLLEVANRTVHGAALSAMVEIAEAYRFYFRVYVLGVNRFTLGYMALIDPASWSSIRPSCAPSARPGTTLSAQPNGFEPEVPSLETN